MRWILCFLALLVPSICHAEVDPYDWPHWRGPEQNGISRETGLISRWEPSGENLLWKNETAGSRATPIVMNGRLYTICRNHPETTMEGEKVICLDAETGELIWENTFNVFLTDAPAERIGWASVVGDPETGNVYALGICDYLVCIDGKTGKTIWSRSMSEEYGMISTYGGRTNFPILFEDLLIVSGVMTGWGDNAIPAHRFVAFDKKNGVAVWLNGTRLRPMDTTYSTPIVGIFDGQAAIVFGSGDGTVDAFQPRTGKLIWRYDASLRGINTTPLVVGNRVYMGHSEENFKDNSLMGAIFALDGTGQGDIKDLWFRPRVMIGRAAPLLVDNRLYFADDGALMMVVDPETGKEIGKQKLGRTLFGSPTYGDGKIYICEQDGLCFILEPTAKGVKILHRTRLNDQVNSTPIISHGKVYISAESALYCLGTRDQKPAMNPRPPAPEEKPASADEKIAQLQIVPVEAILSVGKAQPFQVRAYNAAGRFLKTVPAKLSLKGPGALKQMTYSAGKVESQDAAFVTAEFEGLTSTARVRVFPPLPWSFDFSDKKVPITWIGTAYRHQPRDVEGEPMLVKITTIPKGTRSQGWIGPIDMHDYTIQADLRGSIANDKLPSMGLINQRYTLDMKGAEQALQIRSWTARVELRFAKSIPFAWKPDTWYTMKFQSENQEKSVILRGKVWVRGEPEPEAWTIEGEDKTPNVVGAPGLFGNATDAEIFVDNVKVFSNNKEVKIAE